MPYRWRLWQVDEENSSDLGWCAVVVVMFHSQLRIWMEPARKGEGAIRLLSISLTWDHQVAAALGTDDILALLKQTV
jgi:hypothetical protein